MMFDSTPDISHVDQMSEVIRYIKIENKKVEIKEAFLGFFPLKGKKALKISTEILKQLESDELDIMMCRSQGYDNAATVAGIHGGVQKVISDKSNKAIFNGCIDHSLNLCVQHSFAVNASCVTFFGTIDAIYSFFAASTHRWEVLIKHTNILVKRLSTTRWSVECTLKRRRQLNKALCVSKEHDIPIERRIRLRKKMAGELVCDTKLTIEEENKRTMYECIDRLKVELQAR
nr:uncharacterized protein LOC124805786 [Hydra vulgaris]